jgi:hypothetical protein
MDVARSGGFAGNIGGIHAVGVTILRAEVSGAAERRKAQRPESGRGGAGRSPAVAAVVPWPFAAPWLVGDDETGLTLGYWYVCGIDMGENPFAAARLHSCTVIWLTLR